MDGHKEINKIEYIYKSKKTVRSPYTANDKYGAICKDEFLQWRIYYRRKISIKQN